MMFGRLINNHITSRYISQTIIVTYFVFINEQKLYKELKLISSTLFEDNCTKMPTSLSDNGSVCFEFATLNRIMHWYFISKSITLK